MELEGQATRVRNDPGQGTWRRGFEPCPVFAKMQSSPPCPLLLPALAWFVGVAVFPISTPGRQWSPSAFQLPAAGHGGKCCTTLSGSPLCRDSHSLLQWQCPRASFRACSTRSTLLLVELHPMRPIRRTWEKKGECVPAVPTFAAMPPYHLPVSTVASGTVQAPLQTRGHRRGSQERGWTCVRA